MIESLELGAYIFEIPAIVSSQVGSPDVPNAVCASACVYTYLAADYRYLPDGARIGIHQFGLYEALLHKSFDGRASPFPGQIYPATSVTGVPSAVKPFRTATRTWNSAT